MCAKLYAIPMNLRYTISMGIGMFIAFIGLKVSEAFPAFITML